ncbi:MAG: hypothetical protein PHY28_10710 [Dehalococcoidales bacterium]|nr:hypothetical protein [Dehalococcoidales bacterium]
MSSNNQTLTTLQKDWKQDYLPLLPILALAFYLAYIPRSYDFALHVDEWVHLYDAEAMMRTGSTTFTSFLDGERVMTLSSNLEAGFHLFWGVFQRLSGLDWMTVFQYFPGLIFMGTVLSVFVLARREGYGWQAALCTCLIPTTAGILGPGFLVPVSLGLLFIPLLLFLAFNFRSAASYIVIFIFTCFLLSIHAPTAVLIATILIPFILLGIRGDFRHSMFVTAAIAIPFLAPFPWIFRLLLPTAIELLKPVPTRDWIEIPRVLYTYGLVGVTLCLLGIFVLAIKGGRKNLSLVLALLTLTMMLAVFYTLHYGIPIMYDRGLQYMMLVMSIIAGAGLAVFTWLKLPSGITQIPQKLSSFVGYGLCLVIVIAMLVIAIPEHQQTPYYQMIDQEDYQAFTWIKDNLDSNYSKAILDPWKATAFAAITQKAIYSRIHAYPKAEDEKAYEFLKKGSSDTAFLRENGIDIVYSRQPVANPDLKQVRELSTCSPDNAESKKKAM